MELLECPTGMCMAVRHGIQRILDECTQLSDAAPRVLQALCATQGWPFGTLWEKDRAGRVLRCAGSWHREDDIFLAELAALTRGLTFAKGLGAPGRVWLTGEPQLIEQVRDERTFARREVAAQAGLVSAVVFPILHDGEVLGVIDLIGRASPHDPELHLLLSEVGRQLARFMHRGSQAAAN